MPETDSDFVRRIWPIDLSNRAHAWLTVIEAAALGAIPERIKELAEKWNLTNEDALKFAEHTECFKVFKDGDKWCAGFTDFKNIQESQCGFGDTALEALIELAKPGLQEQIESGTLGKICPLS